MAGIKAPESLGTGLVFLLVGSLAGFYLGRLTAPVETVVLEEDSEDEDNVDLTDSSAQLANSQEECKLVLVVRTDLGMTKGKIAAQCSHATLACYKTLLRQQAKSPSSPSLLSTWENQGQAKVTTQVKSEDELLMLQAQAISLGLCAKIIHDAGRTQIASGSATVLGVGPGPKSLINQVTGSLKLL